MNELWHPNRIRNHRARITLSQKLWIIMISAPKNSEKHFCLMPNIPYNPEPCAFQYISTYICTFTYAQCTMHNVWDSLRRLRNSQRKHKNFVKIWNYSLTLSPLLARYTLIATIFQHCDAFFNSTICQVLQNTHQFPIRAVHLNEIFFRRGAIFLHLETNKIIAWGQCCRLRAISHEQAIRSAIHVFLPSIWVMTELVHCHDEIAPFSSPNVVVFLEFH